MIEMYSSGLNRGVVPARDDHFANSDVSVERMQHLESLLEESEWSRVESEQRVTALEEELLLAKRNELDYRGEITRLEYELNEARCAQSFRGDDIPQTQLLPPPPEFRTKSKSCTQLLAVDYVSPALPLTSLSVGDIDSDTEQVPFNIHYIQYTSS